MRKLLFAVVTVFSTIVCAQTLKIPDEVLFSKESANLQPLCVLMIPETPMVGFCAGLSGGFDDVSIENGSGEIEQPKGLMVTAILVDKVNKKIRDDLDCRWESSNPGILAVAAVGKDNKRLYALLPKKPGRSRVSITMGQEHVVLDVVVTAEGDRLRFEVVKPDGKESGNTATTRPSSER